MDRTPGGRHCPAGRHSWGRASGPLHVRPWGLRTEAARAHRHLPWQRKGARRGRPAGRRGLPVGNGAAAGVPSREAPAWRSGEKPAWFTPPHKQPSGDSAPRRAARVAVICSVSAQREIRRPVTGVTGSVDTEDESLGGPEPRTDEGEVLIASVLGAGNTHVHVTAHVCTCNGAATAHIPHMCVHRVQ